MKPLKQSELRNVIGTVLQEGKKTARTEGQRNEVFSRTVPESPWPSDSPRILLVEDNLVNQKFAVRLLEKRGYCMKVVGTGLDALSALEKEPFDLVLMDVQMPEMDGLEATAHIRRKEKGSGRHVPILAMTAYAMKGDEERCLLSGMDGYISKPIQSEELYQAIDRLLEPGPKAAVGKAGPRPEVLDRKEALQRVGGDEMLLKELARLFLDTYPKQLAELRSALASRDAAALRCAAHGLKGAAGTLGGKDAFAAAMQVESLARAGDLTGAQQACASLEEALANLQPILAELAQE